MACPVGQEMEHKQTNERLVTMKKIKITEQSTETLKADLGAREAAYNNSAVEFRNSKGAEVSCPSNLIDRHGKYAGPIEDKASFEKYLAVYFRANHEAKKGALNGADVRMSAGSTMRTGVRISSTVKGIDPSKAKVGHQFAMAQRMAKEIHAIRSELEARANVERIAAETAAKAQAEASILEALIGTPVAA